MTSRERNRRFYASLRRQLDIVESGLPPAAKSRSAKAYARRLDALLAEIAGTAPARKRTGVDIVRQTLPGMAVAQRNGVTTGMYDVAAARTANLSGGFGG